MPHQTKRRLLRPNRSGLNAAHVPAVSASVPDRLWDKRLQRAANFTQPLILLLGIFGYFYTVVPVFQNQKLQEDNAKLELEKSASEQKLASLLDEEARVSKNIANLTKQRDLARLKNGELLSAANHAQAAERAEQQELAGVRLTLSQQLALLDNARWEHISEELLFAYDIPFWNKINELYNDKDGQHGSFIETADKLWPDPYKSLLQAVDLMSKADRNAKIPAEYFEALKSEIESDKEQLTCKKPDYAALRAQYNEDAKAAEARAEAELQEYLIKTRKEYKDKGQNVVFDDAFTKTVRGNFELGQRFSLDTKYRKEVMDERAACIKVGSKFIDDLAKRKQVTSQ